MTHTRDRTQIKLQFEFAKYITENQYVPILINNLQKVRESKQVTQRELASCMSRVRKTISALNLKPDPRKDNNVSYQRIGNVERGETIPTVLTALKFSDTLGVDIDDLYQIIYINKNDYEMLLDSYYCKEEESFEKIPEIEAIEMQLAQKKETCTGFSPNKESVEDSEWKEIEKEITKIRNKNAVIKYDNVLCGKLWASVENKIDYMTFEKFKKLVEG